MVSFCVEEKQSFYRSFSVPNPCVAVTPTVLWSLTTLSEVGFNDKTSQNISSLCTYTNRLYQEFIAPFYETIALEKLELWKATLVVPQTTDGFKLEQSYDSTREETEGKDI